MQTQERNFEDKLDTLIRTHSGASVLDGLIHLPHCVSLF